ncbi:winged helix-turn-helix transcriptional regulator [Rhodococcus sp. NPDC058505]|uniref:winged helix-turn-helix transcriptional regulator n=1 Tax=unclassified Rhodococcus (in: high G+C Gram-positive bacteria) TaxID=192944 RepID=UPI00366A18DD
MRTPLPRDLFSDCLPGPSPIRVGDKWTARIIACLRDGPRRFSELQVPLHMVSPKVLTASLRSMERSGLLTRTSYPEIPARVEYELTDLGRSLQRPLRAACEWSDEHLGDVLAAQTAHDLRPEP